MTEYIDTVVIGGGQAGLSTSYYLNQNKREHIVLERAPYAGSVWRKGRWDSFTLVTPNWAFSVPGAEFKENERDSFMSREQVVRFFEQYPEQFGLPIRYSTTVLSVEQSHHKGYNVLTADQNYRVNNVVIATGFFQKPKAQLSTGVSPDVLQIHSGEYRNPQSLPEGAVLIVGSAQSGCQIAEELYKHGRKVYLSTGRVGRVPRRYRGKDIIEWLNLVGFFNRTPDQLPPGMGKFQGIPHVSGTMGGHTLNLHKFAQDGVILLGHLRGINGSKISISPDLHENLSFADMTELEVVTIIDSYIQAIGKEFPKEELPQLKDGIKQPVIEELDLKTESIKTVIWATGFTFDYSLIKLPVLNKDGFPVQTRGVTSFPGLFFVGQPWMPSERSGFLLGIGESAMHIASCIN